MTYKFSRILIALLLSGSARGQASIDVQALESPEIIPNSLSSYVGRVKPLEAVSQLAPFPGRVVRQIVPVSSQVKKEQPVLVVAQRNMGELFANYTVKANISGILDDYSVTSGTDFSASSVLFTVLDTKLHRIDLAVSNKDLHQIKPGQTVWVKPENQDKTFPGKVRRRSLSPIDGSGLFAVRIDVPNTIPIGTFCEVSFKGSDLPAASDAKNGSKSDGRRGAL